MLVLNRHSFIQKVIVKLASNKIHVQIYIKIVDKNEYMGLADNLSFLQEDGCSVGVVKSHRTEELSLGAAEFEGRGYDPMYFWQFIGKFTYSMAVSRRI